MKANPNTKALRKGRYSERGRIYLVTIVCIDRARIFERMQCARIVVNTMKKMQKNAQTLCFVVMPDHIHWLMQLERDSTLSSIVQQLKSCVTKQIRRQNLYRRSVWRRGFHDRAIRKEADLRDVARYIVLNPLRAGLVEKIGDYPHWDAMWL
jgi:putative transposase